MDYHKNTLNLLHCDSWLNKFKDVFREGRPKTAIVAENIDAVRQLIMQNRYVAYREIVAYLVIASTNIQYIRYCMNTKNLSFSLISAIAQERLLSIGA